jgi:hypothetical protein
VDEIDRERFQRALLTVAEPLDPRFQGPAKRILCYKTADGRVPAREFLESLPNEAQASYAKSFEKHCQGHQLRGEKHRVWTERECRGLAEYKDIQSKSRIIHVFDRCNTVILLFGFEGKKENRVAREHVERAKRLRDEYRQRLDTAMAN